MGSRFVNVSRVLEKPLIMDSTAEKGSIRADLLWLPDLCPGTPVIREVVGPGQTM